MIGPGFDEVLRAAQGGDEQAIAVLWRDLHPPLLRYLRAAEPSVAEDVESETWLEAARDLHRFEGSEPELRAWMFTIARHRLIDWRRKAARRPARPVAHEDLPERPAVDDVAAAAEEGLGTDAALALVARLPETQRDVVLLRVLGGLDAAQVGRLLGKRPGTVRVLQHRALRRLAELLDEGERTERDVTG